jgi:hypothetical protein
VIGLTAWSAAGIGVSLTDLFGNLGKTRRLIDESFPPAW